MNTNKQVQIWIKKFFPQPHASEKLGKYLTVAARKVEREQHNFTAIEEDIKRFSQSEIAHQILAAS